MGQQVSLEDAAKAVGKSLITLRRAVKAGKLGHQKIKTLTGFVYTVDLDQAKRCFEGKSSLPYHVVSEELKQIKEELRSDAHQASAPEGGSAPKPQSRYRLAVAGESGSFLEYWQKRAEAYEDRYYRELTKHGETREELGVWRGKAENAEGIIKNLLSAGPKVAEPTESNELPVSPLPAEQAEHASLGAEPDVNQQAAPVWLVWLIIVLTLAVFAFGGVAVYLAMRG